MPFNGSGTFEAISAPDYPAVSGTPILASQFNNTLADVFAGLTQCVTRNGQSPATANLPMGGFKLTGLGSATATGQALSYGQSLGFLTRLMLGSGLATSPAIYNSGDTNTGLFWPGTDEIGFATAGLQALKADGNGNVQCGHGASGIAALGTTPLGLELKSGAMNNTNAIWGYGIKFVSADSDFTTQNPKFLAGIFPYASQTYNADTAGGMGLSFFVSPNNPGASVAPLEALTLTHDRHVVPGSNGLQNLGASALRWATGYFNDLDLADDLVVGDSINATGSAVIGTSLTVGTSADIGTTLTVGASNAWQFDSSARLRNTGASQPMFHATRTTDFAVGVVATTIPFATQIADNTGSYATTGIFTAPVAGVYHFDVSLLITHTGGATSYSLTHAELQVNGASVASGATETGDGLSAVANQSAINISITIVLAAADTVNVVITRSAATCVVEGSAMSQFSGALLY